MYYSVLLFTETHFDAQITTASVGERISILGIKFLWGATWHSRKMQSWVGLVSSHEELYLEGLRFELCYEDSCESKFLSKMSFPSPTLSPRNLCCGTSNNYLPPFLPCAHLVIRDETRMTSGAEISQETPFSPLFCVRLAAAVIQFIQANFWMFLIQSAPNQYYHSLTPNSSVQSSRDERYFKCSYFRYPAWNQGNIGTFQATLS